jgi:hypothetical protein
VRSRASTRPSLAYSSSSASSLTSPWGTESRAALIRAAFNRDPLNERDWSRGIVSACERFVEAAVACYGPVGEHRRSPPRDCLSSPNCLANWSIKRHGEDESQAAIAPDTFERLFLVRFSLIPALLYAKCVKYTLKASPLGDFYLNYLFFLLHSTLLNWKNRNIMNLRLRMKSFSFVYSFIIYYRIYILSYIASSYKAIDERSRSKVVSLNLCNAIHLLFKDNDNVSTEYIIPDVTIQLVFSFNNWSVEMIEIVEIFDYLENWVFAVLDASSGSRNANGCSWWNVGSSLAVPHRFRWLRRASRADSTEPRCSWGASSRPYYVPEMFELASARGTATIERPSPSRWEEAIRGTESRICQKQSQTRLPEVPGLISSSLLSRERPGMRAVQARSVDPKIWTRWNRVRSFRQDLLINEIPCSRWADGAHRVAADLPSPRSPKSASIRLASRWSASNRKETNSAKEKREEEAYLSLSLW